MTWRVWLGTAAAAGAAIAAAVFAASSASGGSSRLHPLPRVMSQVCTCDDDIWGLDEGVARCQLASDFLIALAYFSIPLELVYFFMRLKVFPHRWVLLQFGLFIVLCGLTHFVAMWTYGPHPRHVAMIQTTLKVLTAAVSCATAFLLFHIIPALLNIKVRELFLQHKAARMDREMGMIRRQEEVGRHVRFLTQEIRSSVERHQILNTTLMELANTLLLHNCTIWMPTDSSTATSPNSGPGAFLELTHELERRIVQVVVRVLVSDPTVQSIISSQRAVRISPSCALARASCPRGASSHAIAAVRVPLLSARVASTITGASSPSSQPAGMGGGALTASSYGIIVLVLQGDARRQWKAHEVEMVEVVADQVSVALSHAVVLEESQRIRDSLVEQNQALQIARQKAEMALRACNDFVTVANHEMRTPLHSIVALSSILLESELSNEQLGMLECIQKSSGFISSVITDVLNFSQLEEESVQLEQRPFELAAVFYEVGKLLWPSATSKGLLLQLQLEEGLPEWVVGDEQRLQHIVMSLAQAAISNTMEGSVTIAVSAEEGAERVPQSNSDTREGERQRIRVEIRDTCGARAEDFIAYLKSAFTSALLNNDLESLKASRNQTLGDEAVVPAEKVDENGTDEAEGLSSLRNSAAGDDGRGGAGGLMGLNMCAKFVKLMDGEIWAEERKGNETANEVGGGELVAAADRGGCVSGFVVNIEVDTAMKRKEVIEQRSLASLCTDLAGIRVLVLEDNVPNRVVTQQLLETLRCDASGVETALEAITVLTQQRVSYDVVLVDICMPDIDGFHFARRMQQMLRVDERPLMVAVTARTDSGIKEACRDAGMDGLLLKPVTLRQLADALMGLLPTLNLRRSRNSPSR